MKYLIDGQILKVKEKELTYSVSVGWRPGGDYRNGVLRINTKQPGYAMANSYRHETLHYVFDRAKLHAVFLELFHGNEDKAAELEELIVDEFTIWLDVIRRDAGDLYRKAFPDPPEGPT